MDIVDRETRSNMMAGIRGKDTKPEMALRKGLHALGFRFRLHDRKLPGRPDLVFTKYSAVIQVNGCFWHGHDCYLFRMPSTRETFWREKISANVKRDKRNIRLLLESGWRVCTIWECALRGKTNREKFPFILRETAEWLLGTDRYLEVSSGATRKDPPVFTLKSFDIVLSEQQGDRDEAF